MSQPATDVFSNPLQADSLIRADAGDTEGLGCQSIDAADWIIPAGALNLDLAISGLIQSGERNTRGQTIHYPRFRTPAFESR